MLVLHNTLSLVHCVILLVTLALCLAQLDIPALVQLLDSIQQTLETSAMVVFRTTLVIYSVGVAKQARPFTT